MKFTPAKKKKDKEKEEEENVAPSEIEAPQSTPPQAEPTPPPQAEPTPPPQAEPTPPPQAEPLETVQASQKTQKGITTDKIKKLIEALSHSDEAAINPSIDFKKNTISYPILGQIGEDPNDRELLDKLSSKSANILDQEVFERLVVCPQHPEDLSVSIRLYCPECNSMHIERLQLIEHKVCGHIGQMDEFGVTDVTDISTCPNCKRQIKDAKKEIRLPGRWNRCHECSRKFDNAVIKLYCRRFKHDFEINEAATFAVPYYTIKRQAGANVDVITLVPQLKKILTALGFAVDEFSVVKGKSGVSHQTSVYAHNNENKTIAIFIKSSKNKIEDAEINAMLVNVLDISPTRTVLIAIPSVSEMAMTMAAAHGVSVVTGNDFKEILATVEQILSKGVSVSPDSRIDR